MTKCMYNNKQCEFARDDGDCSIGVQNCGWENWDKFPYDFPDTEYLEQCGDSDYYDSYLDEMLEYDDLDEEL